MPIITIAALVMGFSGPTPLCCPATLESITGKPAVTVEYGGILLGTCCGGCEGAILKDPKPLIAKAVKANKTVGAFEYDPISGARINGEKAPAYSDFKSIRYFFASDDEKKTFDAKPADYVGEIKSTAYFCPVMKHATESTKAGAYADVKGVRYFFCCSSCLKAFKADPSKFVDNASAAVMPLKAELIKN